MDYKDVKPKVNVDERRDYAAGVLSRKKRRSCTRASLRILRLMSAGFFGDSNILLRLFRDTCVDIFEILFTQARAKVKLTLERRRRKTVNCKFGKF